MGLNRQQLETALVEGHKDASARRFSLHIFETVPSTNQTLWNLLEKGAEPGSVVIAAQQTAGRGQWGRQWVSPIGGLYLSVAIAPNLPATNSYQLTLASAWGIAMQFRNCNIPVGIKWPNDLVLNDRKLGGILTETKVQQGRISQAVVGVGINWANPVPETGINLQSWQASQHLSTISSLETLAGVTLRGIASGFERYFQEGVDSLLPSYLELLTSMGRSIYINNRSGNIIGVTPNGELRVRLETSATNSAEDPEIHLNPGTISLGYSKSSD